MLPPQLGEGSSCRMALLLFDLGTERHDGPDISTRFCCPTSLWKDTDRGRHQDKQAKGENVDNSDNTVSVHCLICCY